MVDQLLCSRRKNANICVSRVSYLFKTPVIRALRCVFIVHLARHKLCGWNAGRRNAAISPQWDAPNNKRENALKRKYEKRSGKFHDEWDKLLPRNVEILSDAIPRSGITPLAPSSRISPRVRSERTIKNKNDRLFIKSGPDKQKSGIFCAWHGRLLHKFIFTATLFEKCEIPTNLAVEMIEKLWRSRRLRDNRVGYHDLCRCEPPFNLTLCQGRFVSLSLARESQTPVCKQGDASRAQCFCTSSQIRRELHWREKKAMSGKERGRRCHFSTRIRKQSRKKAWSNQPHMHESEYSMNAC